MRRQRHNRYVKHCRRRAARNGWVDHSPQRTSPDSERFETQDSSRYGYALERRAVHAFVRSAHTPEWLRQVRSASKSENHAGVDIWVYTDSGSVPIQVKASAALAKAHQEKHPDIPAIVLHENMTDDQVKARVLSAVVWYRMGKKEAA